MYLFKETFIRGAAPSLDLSGSSGHNNWMPSSLPGTAFGIPSLGFMMNIHDRLVQLQKEMETQDAAYRGGSDPW